MQLGDDNNLFLKEFQEAISPNLRVTIHVRIYSMEDHAGYTITESLSNQNSTCSLISTRIRFLIYWIWFRLDATVDS
jgi:hypothetical protein